MMSRSRRRESCVRLYSCQSCCASCDAIQRRRGVSVCMGLRLRGEEGGGRGQLEAVSAAGARALKPVHGRLPISGDARRPTSAELRFCARRPMNEDEPQRRSPAPPERPTVPMALRVTRPTARKTAADPRAAATSALAREAVAWSGALFAGAAAETGVHARYATRRALLEAGLTGP